MRSEFRAEHFSDIMWASWILGNPCEDMWAKIWVGKGQTSGKCSTETNPLMTFRKHLKMYKDGAGVLSSFHARDRAFNRLRKLDGLQIIQQSGVAWAAYECYCDRQIWRCLPTVRPTCDKWPWHTKKHLKNSNQPYQHYPTLQVRGHELWNSLWQLESHRGLHFCSSAFQTGLIETPTADCGLTQKNPMRCPNHNGGSCNYIMGPRRMQLSATYRSWMIMVLFTLWSLCYVFFFFNLYLLYTSVSSFPTVHISIGQKRFQQTNFERIKINFINAQLSSTEIYIIELLPRSNTDLISSQQIASGDQPIAPLLHERHGLSRKILPMNLEYLSYLHGL